MSEETERFLSPKKCRISAAAMAEIRIAFSDYGTEILDTNLSPRSQAIYIDVANNFIRWLEYEYDPGRRLEPYPLRKKRSGG